MAVVAFGKSGLSRLILIRHGNVRLPGEFAGVHALNYDSKDIHARDVDKLVTAIFERIKRAKGTSGDNDGRLHWLSLFRCSATGHEHMIQFLESHEDDARKAWDVRYERYGVLWGKADNFLIFSVPDVNSFVQFGTYIRKRGKAEQLRSMDSRLIFPDQHYRHPDNSIPKGWVSHLVFLPVEAHQVETVYGELSKRARHSEREEFRSVRISYVGVAIGEDDVFFITDAASTQHHHRYISSSFINKDLMAANTSSFAISNDSMGPSTRALRRKGRNG